MPGKRTHMHTEARVLSELSLSSPAAVQCSAVWSPDILRLLSMYIAWKLILPSLPPSALESLPV